MTRHYRRVLFSSLVFHLADGWRWDGECEWVDSCGDFECLLERP